MEAKIVRASRLPEKQALARQMRREMTPAEAMLWQSLRRNQLLGLHFRRQQVIDGFIADFYCRAARLVIECDGQCHVHQEEYDQERDRILTTHNLQVLRFSNTQVLSGVADVLKQIAAAAHESMSQQQKNPSLTGRGGEREARRGGFPGGQMQ